MPYLEMQHQRCKLIIIIISVGTRISFLVPIFIRLAVQNLIHAAGSESIQVQSHISEAKLL